MRFQTVAWSVGLMIVASSASISAEEPKTAVTSGAAEYFAGALAGKDMKFQDAPVDLSKRDELRKTIFAAYSTEFNKAGAGAFKQPVHLEPGGKNTLSPGEYPIADGLDMPYFVFSRGEKPEGGWPLVIAMHGGGGTSDKLPNPHAWPVNTGEWKAQTSLAASIYPDGAIYFVPRMVDDNNGRWWRDFNVVAFDAMIRHAIVNWEVNPDRVYMLGISEGGYGTEVLSKRMTDRLAAVSAMACGYGSSIHFENMRNLAYRTDVGEKDTMFGRVTNVRHNFKLLEEMHEQDPDGYLFSLNEQKGRGHGVDYKPGPAWMITHTRKTLPERVVLTTYRADQKRNDSAYWLQVTKDLGQRDIYLDARIDKGANAIDIKAEATAGDATYQSPDWAKHLEDPGKLVPADGAKLRLWLHESLIDFSKPLIVRINGKEVSNGKITASMRTMVESLQRSGDPNLIYPAFIEVEVGKVSP
jgi:poly(3-hydroxybutyrate) depolymerase